MIKLLVIKLCFLLLRVINFFLFLVLCVIIVVLLNLLKLKVCIG